MTEQEFIKNCKERGLTDAQAEHCLDLYKYSEDIKWSFEKAKLNFNESQMEQARSAFKDGLTKKQVEVFYKPEFNKYQMSEARLAFRNGLTKEQIEFFYMPEFNWSQMNEARKAFQNGLTIEQVEFFYKQEFNWSQMRQARISFENGSTMEQVRKLLGIVEDSNSSPEVKNSTALMEFFN